MTTNTDVQIRLAIHLKTGRLVESGAVTGTPEAIQEFKDRVRDFAAMPNKDWQINCDTLRGHAVVPGSSVDYVEFLEGDFA